MTQDRIKDYWDTGNVESMYDKNLVEIETEAILEQLSASDRVIDIGCGEGEGTLRYFGKVKELIAIDYSDVRLQKLRGRNSAIRTLQMDMRDLDLSRVGIRVTKAITQRSLINLNSFDEQKEVIKKIHSLLDEDGRYLMLEGFSDGSEIINRVRADFGLPRIEVKWHNCFFNKDQLLDFLSPHFEIESRRDFSTYFFITRIYNAILRHPDQPKWDDPINNLARRMEIMYKNRFMRGISRLELLILRKRPSSTR